MTGEDEMQTSPSAQGHQEDEGQGGEQEEEGHEGVQRKGITLDTVFAFVNKQNTVTDRLEWTLVPCPLTTRS